MADLKQRSPRFYLALISIEMLVKLLSYFNFYHLLQFSVRDLMSYEMLNKM